MYMIEDDSKGAVQAIVLVRLLRRALVVRGHVSLRLPDSEGERFAMSWISREENWIFQDADP
jgi:hypothetical protein